MYAATKWPLDALVSLSHSCLHAHARPDAIDMTRPSGCPPLGSNVMLRSSLSKAYLNSCGAYSSINPLVSLYLSRTLIGRMSFLSLTCGKSTTCT